MPIEHQCQFLNSVSHVPCLAPNRHHFRRVAEFANGVGRRSTEDETNRQVSPLPLTCSAVFHKERVIQADVPAGLRFKGYEDFVVHDLVLRPH
jgi:hypothetical protein